eukprot:CAMPEP_0119479944 /NCGR_PEP_ID=MMETSP1344-20130328/8983_1 /TAXON_ID=236787 /ORGANISM="Florenciella parvula, Strain CCMP2471" /LENGTH=330 /DNA_ID=CAMNT_0007514221 /DNA_START=174 /DNA_END=1163 /DNA_ORIENTATION=-
MSRSALDRFEQKQAQMQAQHSMGYGAPMGIMPMGPGAAYGAVAPLGAVFQQQPQLTGQELEDLEEKRRNEIPLWGNDTTFNMNPLLANRIIESDYFQSLQSMTTYHEVVDEIYHKCKNVEPWSPGTQRLPSTAFCLLTKLLTLRLTTKMMQGMLSHRDSPYIRAIGFLYIRVATEPKNIWNWFEEYIADEEEFAPTADPELKMTIGKWCTKILTDMSYYNTMLPRIPVPVERKIKAYLILFEDEQRRAGDNMTFVSELVSGLEVRAIYGDEDNDPAWYPAVVNEVVPPEEGRSSWPSVVVTFPEYGNQECLPLGKIEIPESITSGGGGSG